MGDQFVTAHGARRHNRSRLVTCPALAARAPQDQGIAAVLHDLREGSRRLVWRPSHRRQLLQLASCTGGSSTGFDAAFEAGVLTDAASSDASACENRVAGIIANPHATPRMSVKQLLVTARIRLSLRAATQEILSEPGVQVVAESGTGASCGGGGGALPQAKCLGD